MTFRDPIALTYLLIVTLTMAFSGSLFDVFLTKHERDCHARNARLLQEQRQGPLQQCT